MQRRSRLRKLRRILGGALLAALVGSVAAPAGSTPRKTGTDTPRISQAAAFDVSKPLRELTYDAPLPAPTRGFQKDSANRPLAADGRHSTDGALQVEAGTLAIPAPIVNFEGVSNQDNADVLGFEVTPTDPIGDVGPNHYVEMVNLLFAVYDKTGNRVLGPLHIGSLWDGFAVAECAEPWGGPIVLYDQLADRWVLMHATTASLSAPFWNCVAVSTSGDPTGSYYRYAFETHNSGFTTFEPRLGVWTNMYVLTTREFGPSGEYGVAVYALQRSKMLRGGSAKVVSFFLDGSSLMELVGDGLLPADLDGRRRPPAGAPIPLVGTQDDGFLAYGATFDALNIWELSVDWAETPSASLALFGQLPTAEFDSVFPCGGSGRDCLAQPDTTQKLDHFGYRQRPLWRLAYRSFKTYDALVMNQSVEARPNESGVRWYEIRRGDGAYGLFQQGTYAPGDGVHRWMGSVAMDRKGNMALGYSVVSGVGVFPGIRYTARDRSDPPGTLPLGEGVIVDGTGAQLSSPRWGGYSSMNVDPVDDCTFWYVNEYYAASSSIGWQTRIASFRLPSC